MPEHEFGLTLNCRNRNFASLLSFSRIASLRRNSEKASMVGPPIDESCSRIQKVGCF
ncbi:uncharacterized protein K452DRAFT_288460 [Aplosporella prunicola CBS 121167]|uniref:Uncharacterized protein n=1 Tax=Aplosporella prunicola CBS 121167 TaxID=1176127 RepID=A0A6A6B9Y2_9PEZI|nr:uncharacterized protein K452DRAFT_288460 [Aplosporella prunicola CBS 121167]KAF2141082.1 hypothetical protein K452DRAFT_288460 [Aplosporella prunicola CBS 121167]